LSIAEFDKAIIIRGSRRGSFILESCLGQAVRYLNLLCGDGNPSNRATMLGCKMARSPADTASYVKD
jgi:hypothetical protein